MQSFNVRLVVSCSFLFLISTTGLVQADHPTMSAAIVLKNARMHTLSQSGTLVGTIVISDGKISAVGANPDIPAGAREFDLTGFTVMPGLIDCRSVLWLTESAAQEKSDNAALHTVDGIDPWQKDWQEVAQQGITAVYVQPGNNSSLGGLGSVLCVVPPLTNDQLVLNDKAGVQAAVGITGATSRDRYSQFQKLKTAIKKVKEGKEPKEAEDSQPSGTAGRRRTPPPTPGRGAGRRGATPSRQATTPDPPDRTEEVLKRVVDGEIPLRIEVHHSDAIGWAASLAKEFEIRVILDGVSHSGSRAPAIGSSNPPLVVGPLLETSTVPAYRKKSRWDWLSEFSNDGGTWALGTFADGPRGSRTLRAQAAAAVALGVSPESVLKAITINAARLLGVNDKVGSIEIGKRADIAVFAGDPLDPSVPATLVICGGQITHQSNVTPLTIPSSINVELPPQFPANFALKSTRVLQDGQLGPATLLVRNGKIMEIGKDVGLDENIKLFDVQDAVITPGLVVAHTYLDQQESLSDDTASDLTHMRATDAVDPTSKAVQVMLDGGFIHAAFAPVSSSTSAGIIGQLRLGAHQYVEQAAVANKFVLTQAARSDERFPSSLAGQFQLVDSMFNGRLAPAQIYVSAGIKRSLAAEKQSQLQAMISEGRKAVFQVGSAREIDAALNLAAGHNLTGALMTSQKIKDQIESIKNNKFGLIIPPSSGSEYGSYFDQLAEAGGSGIPVAFAGQSPDKIRFTAALAVAAGMPRDHALRGLTAGGASMIGMKDGTAQLIQDANADFVIWSGSPLNLASKPLCVVVAGKSIPNPAKK